MYTLSGKLIHERINGANRENYYLGSQLVAHQGAGEKKYIHPDVLGGTAATTNAAKSPERTRYAPYGSAWGHTPKNEIGYTGHKQDSDTGLVYMQARYYDPVIGRFYSNDPVDMVEAMRRGSPVHGFNRYAYAQNNPYKYKDPNGEWIIHAVAGAIGAAVSGYNTYKEMGDWKKAGVSAVIGGGSAMLSLSPGGVIRNVAKSMGVGASANVAEQTLVDGTDIADVDLGESLEAGIEAGVGTLTGSGAAKLAPVKNMPAVREPSVPAGRTQRMTSHPGTAQSDKLKQGLTGAAVGATTGVAINETQELLDGQ